MEKSKVARNERRKKPHAWDFFIHKINQILNYFVERKPLISEECLLVMVYENSISIFRTEYSTAYVGYLNIYQNQNLFSDDCHPSRIKQNFFI